MQHQNIHYKRIYLEDFKITGTVTDKICNVYDLASNCMEWSTETSDKTGSPCILRGGSYYRFDQFVSEPSVSRRVGATAFSGQYFSFRPILYVK